MRSERRQRTIGGIALIILGLGLWALQRMDALGPSALLLLAGGVFLAAYFVKRQYAYLVPGCILMGLGAGTIGEGSLFEFGESSLLGLGFGFVAIFLVALVYERKSQWWPLIPGGVLIALGLPDTARIFHFAYDNWPLALVIVGVLVLLGAIGRTRPGFRP